MKDLKPIHWILIAGFLGGLGATVSSLDHWSDLTHPGIVGGMLIQAGTMIAAVFSPKPGANGGGQ